MLVIINSFALKGTLGLQSLSGLARDELRAGGGRGKGRGNGGEMGEMGEMGGMRIILWRVLLSFFRDILWWRCSLR